jgi:hypothetical protein
MPVIYVWVLINLWLSKGFLILQDNAVPHKATITHQKFAELHFEVLKQPVYSPVLAPSDYYLFPDLLIMPKASQPPLVLTDYIRLLTVERQVQCYVVNGRNLDRGTSK